MFDRYEGSRGSQFLDYISKDIKSRNSKNSNVEFFLFRVGIFQVTSHLIIPMLIFFHRLRSLDQEKEQVCWGIVQHQNMLRVWGSLGRNYSKTVMLIMTISSQLREKSRQSRRIVLVLRQLWILMRKLGSRICITRWWGCIKM